MQPDCLKGRVVCGTVYGDMHLKDLLGSIHCKSRVSYPGPGFLSSATWPSLLKKHYNGLNQTKPNQGKLMPFLKPASHCPKNQRIGWKIG